jgi:hypothetical protein
MPNCARRTSASAASWAYCIGGAGSVDVDGKRFELAKFDCLYVGRGSKAVSFSSQDADTPAAFYLLSYPAHAAFPTTLIPQASAKHVELGSAADANRRTIHQYIHTGGARSCQLVMGYTQLHEGSVWNTMPPHTHVRRSEIYMYFDLGDGRVMHFMGTPEETRHIVMSDRQAVISPSWSIVPISGRKPPARGCSRSSCDRREERLAGCVHLWSGGMQGVAGSYIDQNADVTAVCEGTNKLDDLDYYIDRKRRAGDFHGQAPVLWTSSALLR